MLDFYTSQISSIYSLYRTLVHVSRETLDNVNFAYYNLIIDIIEIMSYNRFDI